MIQTKSSIRFNGQRDSVLHLLALFGAIGLLVACTSTELPPTQEIANVEQAIRDAEQARVTDYALPELQEARAKLSAARIAVAEKKIEPAKRLVQQAQIYVELSVAKMELMKAQAVNDEMEKNISVLKQEMQRNSGGRQ